MMKELYKEIDDSKEFIVDLQANMTSRPAISPANGGEGELDKANYLEKVINNFGFDEVTRLNSKDERAKGGVRPNLIARYFGENREKTLWLLTHLDIVPPGDLSLWKTKPYKLQLDADGDTLYGRGVEDNQQAITAALLAAKTLIESGKRPPINLGIMMIADEEVGEGYGLPYVLENMPHLFGKEDSFLVQDSGDVKGSEIEIAEKSSLWYKLTTTGKQAHSAYPTMGINAMVAGANLVARLYDELPKKFNKQDTLYDVPMSTFTPSKKENNVSNVNIVPGVDVFYLDCRLLPCYTEKELENEIKKIAKSVENDFKVQINVERILKISSVPTSRTSNLVKRYCAATREINNAEPKLIGCGGGTFAAGIRNLGLPAIVASRLYGVPHSPNEKSSIKFTMCDAKVILHTLMHFEEEDED